MLSRATEPNEIAQTVSHDVTLSTPQADEGSGGNTLPQILRSLRFLRMTRRWHLPTTISWALTIGSTGTVALLLTSTYNGTKFDGLGDGLE
jgi:hypothetical protein